MKKMHIIQFSYIYILLRAGSNLLFWCSLMKQNCVKPYQTVTHTPSKTMSRRKLIPMQAQQSQADIANPTYGVRVCPHIFLKQETVTKKSSFYAQIGVIISLHKLANKLPAMIFGVIVFFLSLH